MTWSEEVQRAVTGAVRLARFDEAGMGWFNVSYEGFWRSFSAALLLAPFAAVLRAQDFPATDAPLLVIGLLEALEYAASWAVFPVVMVFLARFLGLEKRYVPFIIAWNWSVVVQIGLLFPITALADDWRPLTGPVGGAATVRAGVRADLCNVRHAHGAGDGVAHGHRDRVPRRGAGAADAFGGRRDAVGAASLPLRQTQDEVLFCSS